MKRRISSMGRCKRMRDWCLFGLALMVVLPSMASAAGPEDYRFPREPGTTKDGYSLPLSGKPITKTPVIVDTPGAAVKKYPEHYIPGKETLAENEMRITACGSWGPAPMRIGQGASCLLVQLGNGDSFIFDIGGGDGGQSLCPRRASR
jgi:ribonuclease Z